MQNFKNTKKVVAGIIQKNGKVLIAQRAKEDALKGKWEFPGGKVEGDETYQECLKRELFEEFSIKAEVGEYVCSSFFEHKDHPWQMLAFKVPAYSGELILHEHAQIHWVLPNDLPNYDFPEPDLPIVEVLMNEA